jgi:alanyl aminopeptidase
MRPLWLCAGLVAFLATIVAVQAQTPELRRLPNDVVPTAYDLALTIDPRQRRFSGEVRISLTLAKPTATFAINGRDLRVTKTTLAPAGRAALAATYEEDPSNPGWASISLASAAPAGKAVLTIAYDAPFTPPGAGLYRAADENGATYAYTQLEPIDARRVFPSFDDPRFKTPYTVTLTARTGDVVVTNGPLVRSETLRDATRHAFAATEPLPTYLVAFAVGPFDVVEAKPLPKTAIRAREVPLRGIAPRGKGLYFERALAVTRPFVEWFEDYFAAPYPYAKLDLIAVPRKPGAMENAGAIMYGERFILIPYGSSKSILRGFAEIHAHELAHQWFGNLVTPAWWDDIWLNEAFATWISYRAASAVMPELGLDHDLRALTSQSLNQDALRDAKSVRRLLRVEADIEAAFDFATYYKGAAVISMMEDYLGRDRFRDALRNYIRRFPHANTTSRDFFASLEQAIGDRQIGPAFESFIDQRHAPVVTGALSCQSEPRQKMSQATYSPLGWTLPSQRWTIPLCAKSYARSEAGERACTVMSEAEAGLALRAKSCPQVVSLNTGAGYFHQAHDAAGWKALHAELGRLSFNEQVAALDGAQAAFAAKAVEPAAYLDLLGKSAASTDAYVLLQTLAHVDHLEKSVTGAIDETYRAWVRSTLSGAFARTAKEKDQELAVALLRTLAINGRDPTLRTRLLEAGRSMINPTSFSLFRQAAPRDLALRVAVEDGGPEVFTALLNAAKASLDFQFRWDALRALGHALRAEDRVVFAAALRDFQDFDIISVLMTLAGEPATAPFAWEMAKAQFEALLVLQPSLAQYVPLFARGLCTAAGRADLAAFLDANKARLRNHEATLSRTVDAIDHCIALRAEQGEPLAAAMQARVTKPVARRRIGADQASGFFEQLAAVAPPAAGAAFGEVVATCGHKFPQASPLAICAATPAPRACRDVRLMLEQCMAR